MSRRYLLSEVESSLNKRGYFLIEGQRYTSCNQKLEIKDSEGYKYFLSYDAFLSNSKGNYNSLYRFSTRNKFTLENIILWIVSESKPYNLLSDKFTKSIDRNLELKCSVCDNIWFASWNDIMSGKGCPICGIIKSGIKRRTPLDIVLEGFKKVNAILLNPNEYKTTKEDVLAKCLICGCEWITDYSHIRRGQSCPRCRSSHGERAIHEYLSKNEILYIPQKRFDGCRHKKRLPFDFYLTDYNVCVEYQGEQPFKPFKRFGGIKKFEENQIRDVIKSNFCENNNIKLFIIPYWEYKNIDIIMLDILEECESMKNQKILMEEK
jgi:predicted Zn-ribbon and HTH transcriptional regulator